MATYMLGGQSEVYTRQNFKLLQKIQIFGVVSDDAGQRQQSVKNSSEATK
jgi:hypothetical protein